jgi:peptide/nickel transport system permease protein
MLLYAARRLVILLATLVFATLIVFAALEVLPGNAAQTMLGASATPEAVAELAHKLGLDRPWPARYLAWTLGALHGDLGQSYAYDSPIAALIGERLEVTLPLTLLAMAIAAAVALTAGVYAAERRGKPGDAIVMGLSQFGLAIPNFWFGIMLVLLFAVHWRLFPAGGFPGWSDPIAALKALILPALSLGLVQAAILTRVTRSALLEATAEDFMRTARAKGLSRRAALWRHALPNAACNSPR